MNYKQLKHQYILILVENIRYLFEDVSYNIPR